MMKNIHISKDEHIVSLGSCFSSEIGKRMQEDGYDIDVNPFGVLYNPASICSSVERLCRGPFFGPGDVVERDPNYGARRKEKGGWKAQDGNHRKIAPCIGGYVSFFHHGSFTRETPGAFLEAANLALDRAQKQFSRSRWILITLGTAWVYRHLEKNLIVSNCHKHLASEFRREFLPVEEVSALLEHMVTCVPPSAEGYEREWIFTVSPIRHIKDGLHNNQISKAALLLGIESLCRKYPHVHYFPSYEIVLDELRDYSYYAEDRIHPSSEAVRYVYERFKSEFL